MWCKYSREDLLSRMDNHVPATTIVLKEAMVNILLHIFISKHFPPGKVDYWTFFWNLEKAVAQKNQCIKVCNINILENKGNNC